MRAKLAARKGLPGLGIHLFNRVLGASIKDFFAATTAFLKSCFSGSDAPCGRVFGAQADILKSCGK